MGPTVLSGVTVIATFKGGKAVIVAYPIALSKRADLPQFFITRSNPPNCQPVLWNPAPVNYPSTTGLPSGEAGTCLTFEEKCGNIPFVLGRVNTKIACFNVYRDIYGAENMTASWTGGSSQSPGSC